MTETKDKCPACQLDSEWVAALGMVNGACVTIDDESKRTKCQNITKVITENSVKDPDMLVDQLLSIGGTEVIETYIGNINRTIRRAIIKRVQGMKQRGEHVDDKLEKVYRDMQAISMAESD